MRLMHLHEEYIERHNLDVSVVRYDKRSTIFLKSKDDHPIRWRIFSVHWNECSWHPGSFEVRLTSPSHNHSGGGNMVRDIWNPENWLWNQYEERMLDFVQKTKNDFEVVKKEEIHLATWHMFLYIHDSLLASFGTEFIYLVSRSLSSDATLEQKNEAWNAAKIQLRSRRLDVHDNWEHQIAPLFDNYAEWLVKLFDQ